MASLKHLAGGQTHRGTRVCFQENCMMGTLSMQGPRPGGQGPFLCHHQTPSASVWTATRAYRLDSEMTFSCRLLDPFCPLLFLFFFFLRKANLIVSLISPEMISHFPYLGGYRVLPRFPEPRCTRPSHARPSFAFRTFRLRLGSLRLACREPCTLSGVRHPLSPLSLTRL